MKKRPSITLLTVLLTMVFAAGIGVYSSYIGMKIYQESSDHLLESFSQISETFTLFVQRNWTVLRQWDGLLKNADIDHAGSIGADMQANKESWHYSDFYLFNESTQYLTADGRRGSADSISGVFQEMYSEGGPIVSTYTASYGVPKIVFAMPLSRNMTLDGVTYTGLAVSYDTDVVDDLVDGSMYGGQSDCYIVRANGDIVLALEPQTELCEGLTNLYDLDAHADWIYGTMDDIKDCVQLGRSGSAQFTCQGGRNYLVAIPTAFPDWTLVGIIRADEVDGAMHSVQQSTIIALGALCIFAVIIVVLALGMESQLRLRREEEERLSLEREKMQSDRLLQSMSRIVDRYSIVNLDTDRYRYSELRLSEPLYPTSGRYSDMVESISERYVALTETENAKLSRLITPEYLRSVLRKPDDNLKIEYCSRTENAYMVLTILPVAWHADGTVYEVMQVVQDIGQKVELENMANTDSMTGLFNERYFSRVLNICEAKKLPFVLYYLDLDRFKPVNDTYGHLMGDRLLKEIAARLLRCIRSRDYAFRIGGDEFALIVSADMDEGQRARMAERIQTTLSAPVVLDGKELSVGVSCGCACYPEDGDASQVRIAADSLTGLNDKQYLLRRMDELTDAHKAFHIITVYAYQLDHINKVAGVQNGDEFLRRAAERMQEIADRNVFRISGKRFLLMTFSLREYETCLTRLRQLFHTQPDDAHAAPTPVILCGVVNAEKLGTSGLVLDYAEYLESLVSRSGETQVIQNDRKTMDSFHYNKQVEQFLHRAIAEDLFEVYYQPVYSLHQQRFVTLEALSRLRHPELGWISPDIFIRLAEKNHLITQITELQLRRVCRFLCENPALRASIANVKINLSPLDLIQSESGSHLVRILGEYGLPCSCFQFEITETVATEYSASLTRVAESLQTAGIGLCLDDFGSGYANLNTVMQLPFSSRSSSSTARSCSISARTKTPPSSTRASSRPSAASATASSRRAWRRRRRWSCCAAGTWT